ncbi:Positive transcriptional regulator, MutR family [Lactococcus piscium]|uniref:Positive transcriptional regulator, MutR family n=2 Tax=Pseudolactococcus piscium TaxID=1364 RepID=A0A2A5RUL4_9LACT|nr:Positive transcriptional regulator, MutR family [Lactococcus piscium]
MALGAYYKKTREARGYSIAEIETDYLHSSQLSRFEKGKSMFSAECLLLAIQRLNMTPTEFFALMPNYEPSRLHVFMQEISNFAMENDIVKMKQMLKPDAKKTIDRLFNIMAKVAIFDSSQEDLITDQDRQLVYDYLTSIQQWTLFEIDVFSSCLAALDIKSAYYLGLEMLESNDLSDLLNSHGDDVKKALINLYVHLISHEYYARADTIKRELSKLFNAWDMEGRIIIYIFDVFSRYKREKSADLFEEIQRDIQSLKKFGVTAFAERIEMFLQKT